MIHRRQTLLLTIVFFSIMKNLSRCSVRPRCENSSPLLRIAGLLSWPKKTPLLDFPPSSLSQNFPQSSLIFAPSSLRETDVSPSSLSSSTCIMDLTPQSLPDCSAGLPVKGDLVLGSVCFPYGVSMDGQGQLPSPP